MASTGKQSTVCKILSLALLAPGAATAGSALPTVTHSPFATSVPTLGNAMLLLLALFLAMLAVRMLRSSPDGGNRIASIALGAGFLAMVAGGVAVVNGVRALQGGAPPAVTLFDQAGGATVTLAVSGENFTAQVANGTPVAQQITDISPGGCSLASTVNAGLVIAPPSLPEGGQEVGTCEVGLVLPPNDYCSLELFNCPETSNGGAIEDV